MEYSIFKTSRHFISRAHLYSGVTAIAVGYLVYLQVVLQGAIDLIKGGGFRKNL